MPRFLHRVLPPHLQALIGLWMVVPLSSMTSAQPSPEPHRERRLPTAEEIADAPADGGEAFNRLVFEKSPYLLQHARNPVDWYPWGAEAFDRAKAEGKMVFLSVGYSTCHWCHVMERESFEDDEVAALMNEAFICVKVDREERPDIDQVYMTVTQALTGSGGWPMTVIMTPEKKPFFAATYIPKQGRFGRPGMMELIPQLQTLWANERDRALQVAENIANELPSMVGGSPGAPLTESTLNRAFAEFKSAYDREHAGFRASRKFPTPHNLSFLLRYWKRTGEPEALSMATETLKAMRRGGLWDHVGFGTHRYSTDPEWLLPHFEKMLYDQALLAMANTEAFLATGDATFEQTTREILEYVLRDMTDAQGGFYSAEDADSEGEEGLFYLWKPEEVLEALNPETAGIFMEVYNIREGGNFKDEATGETNPRSIPHLTTDLSAIAKRRGIELSGLRKQLEDARQTLFAARETRIHPLKDDKLLTDWNGLMIAAMAKAHRALGEERYAIAATKAADRVLSLLKSQENGRLLHRYRDGEAGLPAHLDDYAFLTWGLIELYESTFEPKYLREALALNEMALTHFWDEDEGGFYLTANDGEALIARSKEIYDGAIPSGNAVAAYNLIRLGRISANPEMETKAERVMAAFSEAVSKRPSSHSMLMMALDMALGASVEIVIAGDLRAEEAQAMLRASRSRYLPQAVTLHRPDGDSVEVAEIAPFLEAQRPIDGKVTGYICRNYACDLPTTDVETFLKGLRKADAETSGIPAEELVELFPSVTE